MSAASQPAEGPASQPPADRRADAKKAIAILQSNYIPWKGYFDIIGSVDEFVIFDEVQFTRNDWRNRNRVVNRGRVVWLTIPVQTAGRSGAPIDAIEIADRSWAERHLRYVHTCYRDAEYTAWLAPRLEALYHQVAPLTLLSDINEQLLRALSQQLGLSTPMLRSRAIPRRAITATARLVEICQARGASVYVSGPAARAYIEPGLFRQAGIELRYADYSGYPIYDQATTAFDHHVSIVDTLFRCGPATHTHLKSRRGREHLLETA